MRIRTVKPEFWSHPVMGRASDGVKLMAIGLLNVADDKGFFYLDPILIRNAVRPYDADSSTTHGLLTELSLQGYFEVRNHPTHGQIGWIVSFEEHQVINRPSKRTMKELWDSCMPHTTLTECSVSTHPGKEGKGKEIPLPPLHEIDQEAVAVAPLGGYSLKSHEDRSGSLFEDAPDTVPTSDAKARQEPTSRKIPASQHLEMIRLGTLFRRKPTTAWSEKEKKALKAISLDPEEFELICAYYGAEIPPKDDIRRRDLVTLLNNWNGEVDRARRWKAPADAKRFAGIQEDIELP